MTAPESADRVFAPGVSTSQQFTLRPFCIQEEGLRQVHLQRRMIALLVDGLELTSRECEKEFQVTRDTANRDFKLLIELGIARRRGAGRSTRYALAMRG